MQTQSDDNAGGARRKFLVVVDETAESRVALRFACRRARHTGGSVTLLAVIEPEGFQHWLGVENLMKEEAREEAQTVLDKLARELIEKTDMMPELIIREGRKEEQVRALIAEDSEIAVLVLGAGDGPDGPGPLVSMITGQGSGGFPIPVTVVPGTLSDQQLKALA